MSDAGPEIDPDLIDGQVVALGFNYPSGHEVAEHFHRRDQLVYASSGVMAVTTAEGSWTVPGNRALWLAAEVSHRVRASGLVEMRTVYLSTRLRRGPTESCQVLNVSALLRELLVRAVQLGPTLLRPDEEGHHCFVEVLLDEIARARQRPLPTLHLPEARDARLARLLDGLRAAPRDRRSLAEWGHYGRQLADPQPAFRVGARNELLPLATTAEAPARPRASGPGIERHRDRGGRRL